MDRDMRWKHLATFSTTGCWPTQA